jgi:hypothetical protein
MENLETASTAETCVGFDEDEVAVVKKALATKLYLKSEDLEVRKQKWQVLLTDLSEKFGVPEVQLHIVEEGHKYSDRAGFGRYDPDMNTLVTNKRFSLTTLLSRFAVALRVAKGEELAWLNPSKFALSLFKAAAPEMFNLAKTSGRLMGTDQLFTDGGKISREDAERRAGMREPEEYTDDEPEGAEGDVGPDVDPENRDRGNGPGED